MKSRRILKEIYVKIKPEIEEKLKEFENIYKSDEKTFMELIFCLLTPQSKAETCWNTVLKMKRKGFLKNAKIKDLIDVLKGIRFRNNKANYIVNAQKMFVKDGKIVLREVLNQYDDELEIREFLVKNVKGLGMKEASHFLRNIGKGQNIAILDRHILRCLKDFGVIKETPLSLSKNKYLEIEDRMRKFSEEIGIPISHLDFVCWYLKTGRIFK